MDMRDRGVSPEEDEPMANYKYPADYRAHAVQPRSRPCGWNGTP